MVLTYEEIIGAALSLPPGSRAMLAEHLMVSLDSPNQKEIDDMWGGEIEKRVKEVEEGQAITLDGEQVLRELRSRK